MVQIIKRLKNLWEWSAYRPLQNNQLLPQSGQKYFYKDFPTIEKKLATIIPEKEIDVLEEEIKIND